MAHHETEMHIVALEALAKLGILQSWVHDVKDKGSMQKQASPSPPGIYQINWARPSHAPDSQVPLCCQWRGEGLKGLQGKDREKKVTALIRERLS